MNYFRYCVLNYLLITSPAFSKLELALKALQIPITPPIIAGITATAFILLLLFIEIPAIIPDIKTPAAGAKYAARKSLPACII